MRTTTVINYCITTIKLFHQLHCRAKKLMCLPHSGDVASNGAFKQFKCSFLQTWNWLIKFIRRVGFNPRVVAEKTITLHKQSVYDRILLVESKAGSKCVAQSCNTDISIHALELGPRIKNLVRCQFWYNSEQTEIICVYWVLVLVSYWTYTNLPTGIVFTAHMLIWWGLFIGKKLMCIFCSKIFSCAIYDFTCFV